jgi:hypothetical protein
MKKRIFTFSLLSLLLVVGLAGTVWGTSIAEAGSGIWNSCPRGRINCAYPEACHSYIDTNNDAICDRSQAEPQSSTSTNSAQVDSSVSMVDGENSTNTEATGNNSQSYLSEVGDDAASSSTTTNKSSGYNFLAIMSALIAAYLVTWLLAAAKKVKQVTHRRIWNVVLGVSGLVSAVLGLLLLLNLDLGLSITPPFDMLYWHVEAGIALGLIAIFHIGWHWRYFTRLFGNKG